MTKLIRPLRSGQMTIPAEFRKRLGISESSILQLSIVEGELRIKPVKITNIAPSPTWLDELYQEFAPIREEAKQYTEQEINDTIATAITAVRKSHA